ncbi:MAG: IS66-like element accessory protein TnpA [Candidatus Acidiferrales bacterium]
MVDTSNEIVSVRVAGAKKRRRSVEERRRIVEATLQPGASVSRVARRHDVNANQVFHWRKLYREGRLGSSTSTKLLPVKVTDERSVRAAEGDGIAWRMGTIEIQLPPCAVRCGEANFKRRKTPIAWLSCQCPMHWPGLSESTSRR